MGVLLTYPKFRAENDAGKPLVGGLVYTYIAGATPNTNKATYSDKDLTTPNANPVVLDRRGEAVIYGAGSYKIVLKDSYGNAYWTMDDIELTAIGSYQFFPNPSEIDQGATSTGGSIKDILTELGTSKKAEIVLLHDGASNTTTYTVGQNIDWSTYTNVSFVVKPGAILSHGAYTLNIPNLSAGSSQVFSGTGTVTLSGVPYVRASWFSLITFGTGIAAGDQTNNHLALQRALTSSVASGIPMSIPSGIILVNDEVLTTSAFHIESEGYSKILQTATAKTLFVGGTSDGYTYDYYLKNMQLATADGSYDCIKLTKAIQVVGDNVLISGSGRYGWYLDACQELHLKACHNNGYVDLITGQNGGTNGKWGDGATTGGAFYITGATTTLQLDGCDMSICTRGIINESTGLALIWNGTAQGMIGNVISGSGGLSGYDIDIYADGFGDTPGGIVLDGSNYGKIHFRNTDLNGVELTGCSGVELSGQINRVSIDADCKGVEVHDGAYGMVTGGGYVLDLAPDTKFTNFAYGSQENVYRGTVAGTNPVSVCPNGSFDKWMGNNNPCGWTAYGGATITQCGTGLGDTTKFSGDYSAKVVGHASATSGIIFYASPDSHYIGKYVTVRGRYKSDAESYVTFLYNDATKYDKLKSSGSEWARFEVTAYVPTTNSSMTILLQPGASETVYYDDVDILIDGFAPLLPQTFDDGDTTPAVTYDGGSIPCTFWKFDNSGATNVTHFDKGYPGLVYTFWLDGNTTLIDGATLQLRGGANKSGANTFVNMVYDSTTNTWFQVSYESAI